MNYQCIYNSLITRGVLRQVGKKRRDLGVVERHHIIPRCVGGTNDTKNLVFLTPEEHYVAHQLLCKLYPKNKLLIYAVRCMSLANGPNTLRNNKSYGWIRRAYSESVSGENNHMYGKTGLASPNYGRPGPMIGKTHTSDTKQKMSIAHSGENHWMYGRPKEDSAMFGKTHSEETKKLMSDAHIGDKNPMYGKIGPMTGKVHTDETKVKMKTARALQTFSNETKQKMRDAWLRKPIQTCPHCSYSSNHIGNMNRFHFDNCKKIQPV